MNFICANYKEDVNDLFSLVQVQKTEVKQQDVFSKAEAMFVTYYEKENMLKKQNEQLKRMIKMLQMKNKKLAERIELLSK